MTTPPQSLIKSIPAEDPRPVLKHEIDVLSPFPPVKATILDPAKHSTAFENNEDQTRYAPAERLPTSAFKSEPATLPASTIKEAADGARKDAPKVVFLPDDRHIFQDSSFPFSLIGKVRTAVSTSSATVVGPRHILTASHCVNWTRDANGNIGWMSFTPSYFDGRGPWGEFYVTNVIAYRENGHRMTDEESAWDYAVCILNEPINTKVGGYAGAKGYNRAWNGQAFWQSFGYPADLFNAERPEFQSQCIISTNQPFGEAQLLGHFNDIYPGQSGGPVWGKWDDNPGPSIVGVVSTEPDVPQLGSTTGDNQYAGGGAMVELVLKGRKDHP